MKMTRLYEKVKHAYEKRKIEETDNSTRLVDGPQDVSQSPDVKYDEEGNEVKE
jgi:hypothetical protein